MSYPPRFKTNMKHIFSPASILSADVTTNLGEIQLYKLIGLSKVSEKEGLAIKAFAGLGAQILLLTDADCKCVIPALQTTARVY